MSIDSFDRNYGMTTNSREYWGGDNGFVTILVSVPTDVEFGETLVAQDGSDAAATAFTAANRNQFRISEIIATRAVLVTTSALGDTIVLDPSFDDPTNKNVIAFENVGLTAGDTVFGITYLVERQDVFETQQVRPGAVVAVPVKPLEDICKALQADGLFLKKDGTAASAVTGVAVKVLAALPVLL